ncbi:MAG: MMPL family transporter [Bacteroidota bacterium]
MERIADLLLRYPRAIVAVLVVALLACGGVLLKTGIVFDYNLENFLPADDASIELYRAFVEEYEEDDAVIVIGFAVDDAFEETTLRDIEAMTAVLDTIAGVQEVTSVANVQGLRGTAGGIEIRELVGDDLSNRDSLVAYRARVLADSLAAGYVVNREADAATLLIRLEADANDYTGRKVVLDQSRAVLAGFPAYDFRITGFPFLRNNYVDKLQVETIKYVVISSLINVLILLWMFRTPVGVLLPMAIVYLGILATVAVMMTAGAGIDVLGSTIFALILVVGIADSMHFLVKYYHSLERGLAKRAAVRRMVVRLGAATFLTSITTAIGFGTLLTANVIPMKRFGLYTAIGVLLTFVISLIVITAVLLWTKPPTPAQIDRLSRAGFRPLLMRLDGFTQRHRWPIVAAFAVLLAVSALGATQLRINTFINDDLGPESQAYKDMRFVQDNIVAPFGYEILVESPDLDAFKEPEALRQIDSLAAYLRTRPEVSRVASVADLLKQLNVAMHADSSAFYRIPESRDLAAQYLFLLELTDEDAVRRLVDYDYAEARVAILMDDIGSAHMKGFQADLDSALAALFPGANLDPPPPDTTGMAAPVERVTITQTGTVVLGARMADSIVTDLLTSIGLAFLFISLLMGLLFRNVRFVLISLVPNIVPLVVIAGVMGVMGIDVKPATAVIFTIAFGIAVDDTIHFLARLRQELRLGQSLEAAVRETMLGTGKAIILTSIVLLGGFGSLMTSVFQSTAYLGGLVALTIFMAVLADLVLLPALVHIFKPKLAGARSERVDV